MTEQNQVEPTPPVDATEEQLREYYRNFADSIMPADLDVTTTPDADLVGHHASNRLNAINDYVELQMQKHLS